MAAQRNHRVVLMSRPSYSKQEAFSSSSRRQSPRMSCGDGRYKTSYIVACPTTRVFTHDGCPSTRHARRTHRTIPFMTSTWLSGLDLGLGCFRGRARSTCPPASGAGSSTSTPRQFLCARAAGVVVMLLSRAARTSRGGHCRRRGVWFLDALHSRSIEGRRTMYKILQSASRRGSGIVRWTVCFAACGLRCITGSMPDSSRLSTAWPTGAERPSPAIKPLPPRLQSRAAIPKMEHL